MIEQYGIPIVTAIATVLAILQGVRTIMKQSIRDAVQLENRLTKIEVRLEQMEGQMATQKLKRRSST